MQRSDAWPSPSLLVVLAPPVGARERGDGPSGATQVVRVRIVDNAFRPRNLTVARGDVVRWVNRGTPDPHHDLEHGPVEPEPVAG